MNVTFSALAKDVEDALQEFRDCESLVKKMEEDLGLAKLDMVSARQRLEEARDAMFEAHPELLPRTEHPLPVADGDWQPPGPGMFTPVEVDDPDDVPDFRER